VFVPSADDIRQQTASELKRRSRLAVPAFGGGFLYLLSAIVISDTLNGAPSVGLIEGLTPALRGEANPTVSPRTNEVKFISHHASTLIGGSFLAAVAIGVLTLVLLLLFDAARFRRPNSWAPARLLVLGGGIAVASVSVAHQIVSALETHKFAVGHDFSNRAVELAITQSTANQVVEYVDLLAGLALAAGMIAVMLNALRVGLVPRWMGILGMFSGLLILLPLGGAELQIVPALWLVMMGMLYVGRWPGGDPPAWASGEARPWPSGAQMRAARRGGEGSSAFGNGGADVAPAPAAPTPRSSRKRRKRGVTD
jgi:hypothetical protein